MRGGVVWAGKGNPKAQRNSVCYSLIAVLHWRVHVILLIGAQGDGKGKHHGPVPLQMLTLRQEEMNVPS